MSLGERGSVCNWCEKKNTGMDSNPELPHLLF